jgi:hypothetical protein
MMVAKTGFSGCPPLDKAIVDIVESVRELKV